MRKYSKCGWCGTTIDVTNTDNDLCVNCSKYSSFKEMLIARRRCPNCKSLLVSSYYRQGSQNRKWVNTNHRYCRKCGMAFKY